MARKRKASREPEKYTWRKNRSIKIDANDFVRVLNRLPEKSPERIVDAARNEKSPIHEAFVWDDSLAAELHRRQQARWLCQSLVRVETSDSPRPPPTLVSVVTVGDDGEKHRAYQFTDRAMSNPEWRSFVLSEARRGLETWRDRYASLEGVGGIIREVLEEHINGD